MMYLVLRGHCEGHGDKVPLTGTVVRPPLSKKSFPVSRVGKIKASQEVGNLFSPLISFFFNKLEWTGGGGGGK